MLTSAEDRGFVDYALVEATYLFIYLFIAALKVWGQPVPSARKYTYTTYLLITAYLLI